MELHIKKEKGVSIQPDMIGLFFEDINYAADGGLYAEMLENRSFEFVEAFGEAKDYYTTFDGHYGWSAYPSESAALTRVVMGSPLTEENPHYMRLEAKEGGAGIRNQAFDGVYLKEGQTYRICFWARNINYNNTFIIKIEKDGTAYAETTVSTGDYQKETYNFYKYYETILTADADAEKAEFIFALTAPGIVELDFISMMPTDAVEGIFRKDLYEKLADLKPGFLRFPGGCIVEGNTLHNRYRFKDTLKPVWARRNNWNRWAVHGNNAENDWHSQYSHYNQTLGLGYYEYFLLCEKIGAKAIPVMNVGFACQYQSAEILSMDDPAWQEFVQDALDLIEFANGDVTTKWGSVRADMGHEAPFGLTMLGIGNEQWQTERADFFERYVRFEEAIHAKYPEIKLIGSAGPDITSERYEKAWKFYNEHKNQENFVYAVDEHYYVKPQWLFDHVDFYDNYDRTIKVFSGEYAAHPVSGMNRPEANNLEGALAEAAFLTGVERNADVVVLASYAPLFAKLGYAQWSPDMIWFDGSSSYGSPSYYVQKLYGTAVGNFTLQAAEDYKEAWEENIYYSISYKEAEQDIIIKIVNANEEGKALSIKLDNSWQEQASDYRAQILTGPQKTSVNSIQNPENVAIREVEGDINREIALPALSFSVIRVKTVKNP
ncbi:MAG: carbohydrate binding domain-containing protein [Lachnospiraceae bacterium]|nr:carbohydrate binding domain-containing protein [Lachnospiraceae bacterium]